MNRKSPLRTVLLFLLKLGVSAGMLAWIFSRIPVRGVWDTLLSAHAGLLVAAYLVMVLNHWTYSIKTCLLTRHQGLTLSVHDIFRIAAVTSFYKLILPGGVGGGVIRWYKLARRDNKPMEAFNVMMYDRVTGTIAMALLAILYAALDPAFMEHPYAWPSALVLLVALAAPILYWILAFNGRWSRWLYGRLPAFIPERMRAYVHTLIDSADRFSGLEAGMHVRIWIWSFFSRLLTLYFYYLFAQALNLDLSFAAVAWVRTVVYLLILIPISFSGLGVREGAMLLLLIPYGVDAESTVAFSMLSFLAILIMGFWGGGYELYDLLKYGHRRGVPDKDAVSPSQSGLDV